MINTTGARLGPHNGPHLGKYEARESCDRRRFCLVWVKTDFVNLFLPGPVRLSHLVSSQSHPFIRPPTQSLPPQPPTNLTYISPFSRSRLISTRHPSSVTRIRIRIPPLPGFSHLSVCCTGALSNWWSKFSFPSPVFFPRRNVYRQVRKFEARLFSVTSLCLCRPTDPPTHRTTGRPIPTPEPSGPPAHANAAAVRETCRLTSSNTRVSIGLFFFNPRGGCLVNVTEKHAILSSVSEYRRVRDRSSLSTPRPPLPPARPAVS